MAKKRKNTEGIKSPEAIAEKFENAEHWAEQNPKVIFGILAAVTLIVGGYLSFRYYINNQEQLAQRDMFQAVHYFEADSLQLALEGDGNNLGFSQIIRDYGMTSVANLANYYAGIISLKQGEFALAVTYLNDFDSDDVLLQSRAYSLIGDAHMELEQYADAVTYYEKASSRKPNKFFTPAYLLKEALAHEKLNQNDDAQKIYQKIVDQYWDSDESSTAKKFKARLHTSP